jgi:hypothetical protein
MTVTGRIDTRMIATKKGLYRITGMTVEGTIAPVTG